MTLTFDQIVFSGGGLRCFWQGGFMEELGRHVSLSPKRVTGVSGGALAGAAWLGGAERTLLDCMRAAFEEEAYNATLEDMLNDEDGRTPHQRVYDEVVHKVLDETAQARIADGPAFQILIGYAPSARLSGLTGAAMTVAYEAELHVVNSPHFNWAETAGMGSELVDARAAARGGELADLVCAAATIPPLFQTPEWHGKPVIDGGMADQAPMPDPNEGSTLVLLTRQYRRLPGIASRRYVAPSKETPADKIDFTDPDKLTATWDLGRDDGAAFIRDTQRSKEE
ncbi:patatin-like phospholipase family protein [Alphaproteobacteria bacterium GH1-50]|uniref:Patatin-like phospholipase family protein n=1 Tax=Kangsaoukella pontilimi TaxID=2691042 RepID=A0A7C9IHT2_9RHOB|nr:patatin-like phospholipase family protein [Kangsaoukella pontilimi]MXQ09288.1 patatin-like phospholipase family protein [Kangsaoukella pontilimi]